MKRSLYVLGIIAAVALIIWAGYALRYRAPESTESTGGGAEAGAFPNATRGGGIGEGAQGGTTGAGGDDGPDAVASFVKKLRKVSDLPIVAFRALPDGSALVMQTDGQMKKISDGKTESLSAAPIPNIVRASFSADGTKALVTTATDDGERLSVFDLASRTWSPLGPDARAPSWSPAGRTLVYVVPESGRTALVSLDAGNAKAKPQTLLSLPAEDLVPQWVAADVIALIEKPSARIAGSAWLFNLKKKTLTKLADGEAGLVALWNSSGTRVLVLSAKQNRTGGSLSLRDGVWQDRRELSFLSLPFKCIFGGAAKATSSAQEYLFCGIPRDSSAMAGAELPDAYFKGSLFTSDNLYSIDLGTGEIQLLYGDTNEDFDIANLSLVGDTLYFRDRFTNALYALSL